MTNQFLKQLDSDNYKEKYLKYKNKYLTLKNNLTSNQIGGAISVPLKPLSETDIHNKENMQSIDSLKKELEEIERKFNSEVDKERELREQYDNKQDNELQRLNARMMILKTNLNKYIDLQDDENEELSEMIKDEADKCKERSRGLQKQMEGIKLKLEKKIKDEVAKRAALDVRKSQDMSDSRRQMGYDRERSLEQAKGLQKQMQGQKDSLERKLAEEKAKRAALGQKQSQDMSDSRSEFSYTQRQISDAERQMDEDRERSKQQAKGLQKQMQGQKDSLERKLTEEKAKRGALDQRQAQDDAARKAEIEQAVEKAKTSVRGVQNELRNKTNELREEQRRERELRSQLEKLQGQQNAERRRQIEEEVERAKDRERRLTRAVDILNEESNRLTRELDALERKQDEDNESRRRQISAVEDRAIGAVQGVQTKLRGQKDAIDRRISDETAKRAALGQRQAQDDAARRKQMEGVKDSIGLTNLKKLDRNTIKQKKD